MQYILKKNTVKCKVTLMYLWHRPKALSAMEAVKREDTKAHHVENMKLNANI